MDIYGEADVSYALILCDKYGINPNTAITQPPTEGQTLVGWGLGIENPESPANKPLINIRLTEVELNKILSDSIKNPNSKVVVLGYGNGNKPYFVLGDEINGSYLSLDTVAWEPFENARANFLTDINIPFIEMAIENRKVFVFNIEYDVITNPRNAGRFSLPELKLH
ncbi:MAG: hypothetical protein QM730_25800 [Anaerolineales bacterium]